MARRLRRLNTAPTHKIPTTQNPKHNPKMNPYTGIMGGTPAPLMPASARAFADSAGDRPALSAHSRIPSSTPRNRTNCRIATAAFLLPFALLGPLAAQTAPATTPEERTVLLKQIGDDGTETIKAHKLAAGEGLVTEYLNGKAISSQVVGTAENRRVIIQLKGASLAQQYKRGLRKAGVRAAKQSLDSSRENFKGRMQTIENRRRAAKGRASRSAAATITHEFTYCFNGVAAQVDDDSLAEIRQMPEVSAIYLDQEFHKCDGYGISQIGAPAVWQQIGATGQGVAIAVVDTGVYYRHPDLGAGFGPDKKVVGGYDFVNNDADPDDDNGHGTHVAGIAAANGQTKGVAPDASLLAVKVLDARGSGMESNIIAGVEWAVANGANIINMSLGGTGNPDSPLSQAVDHASEAGVLVVVAAGNTGGYQTVGSPASARTALTVGADDQNSLITPFSSRGPAAFTLQIKPEVVAPGFGIVSTVPLAGTEISNPTGYASLNGTSMAAPHAAGAAALLLQQHPDWTPQQLKLALISGAVDIGQDVMTQGSGEIDVFTSATLPVLCSEGELSLGWDDLRNPTFAAEQPLTFTNTSAAPVQLALSTQFTSPPGMSVTVAPATISLQPAESRTVSFRVNVDNQVTPNLPAAPFTYGGAVVATLPDGSSVRRPFALCKAPKLRITPIGMISTILRFHGADTPALSLLFSTQPTEQLVAAGTYDFVINFADFMSFPPLPRTVIREKVVVAGYTDLTVASTEATNRLELRPIDEQGIPLFAGRADFTSMVVHKATNSSMATGLSGFPIALANACYVSNFSDTFAWHGVLGSMPDVVAKPAYVFNSSLLQGLAESKSFSFTPADFNKSVVVHHGRPDQPKVSLVNWNGFVRSGGSSLMGTSTPPTTTPVDQVFYSVVTPNAAFAGGFWASDAISATPTGKLPAPDLGTLYKSAIYRPETADTLVGLSQTGTELYRGSAKRLQLGQGAAYWSGSLQNLPKTIRIQTTMANAVDQKLFSGQCQEELIHGLLPYTLTQRNRLVASGNLDGAMEYLPGRIKPFVVEMNVAPGPYELTIPFTEFFQQGKPGQLEVVNKFDTTRADPNPPYLTGFQVTNPLDCQQLDPFIDILPPTGGELRFGVDDEVRLKNVTLTFQLLPNLWLPLPMQRIDEGQYAAYLPWLGFARDAIKVKLVATDASGNSLTMTENILCEKR